MMARSKSSGGCTRRARRSTAVAIARSIFDRYSFDLIYARPGQTPQAWAAELRRAAAEAGEHLSLYQLTIEQDTPFAALHAAGKLVVPDDDTARALYDTTQSVCARAGLPAYEISNHARPGAECRHNLIYWRAHEYAGIGPGAHGRLDIAGGAPRHRDREAAGELAHAGGIARAWRRHRRGAHARANGGRVSADGTAAGRGHRSRALRASRRSAARSRAASRCCASKARSRRRRAADCA